MRSRPDITGVLGIALSLGTGCVADASEVPSGATDSDGGSDTSASGASNTTVDASGTESGSESGSAEGTSDASSDAGSDTGSGGASCPPVPTCDATPPSGGDLLDWTHNESYSVVESGSPGHRGRDMFFVGDEPQWVLGKIAYGPTDWDLEDERVDLWLLRDCEGDWELLASTRTTAEGQHIAVEGVEDTGGRVYFEIPVERGLGPGRHRVHMVVRGDDTRTDMYIEIVEAGTPIFVSDIDGTLTTSESEEFFDLLTGATPEINAFAAEALNRLADRGYRPMYVTARPEFLGARTQQFVRERGLPPGIVHTSLNFDGALGDAAVEYKTGELMMLQAKGLVPSYVFGNTESDGEAYENLGLQPLENRIFFQFEDPFGGRTIQSYGDLLPEFDALPTLCEP